MSVIVDAGGERWLYCKGAPEAVMPLCARFEHGGSEAALDAASGSRFAGAQEAMADVGLRVLAFAFRKLAGD